MLSFPSDTKIRKNAIRPRYSRRQLPNRKAQCRRSIPSRSALQEPAGGGASPASLQASSEVQCSRSHWLGKFKAAPAPSVKIGGSDLVGRIECGMIGLRVSRRPSDRLTDSAADARERQVVRPMRRLQATGRVVTCATTVPAGFDVGQQRGIVELDPSAH